MQSKHFVLALSALMLGAGWAPNALAQPALVLARVHIAKDASDTDVLRIRDNMVSFGVTIKGYARGDTFVVAAPAQQLASIASVDKVKAVDLLPSPPAVSALRAAAEPLSAEQLVAMMPKNGLREPTPQQAARAAKLLVPAPKAVPGALSQRRARLSMSAAGLPSVVDNSLSAHFPPIGDQEGRNTCVAWATAYYWGTYTQAADEGIDVTGAWLPRDPPCDIITDGKFDPVKFAACQPFIKDPPRPSRATEHIGSPSFLYPLIHVRGLDANGDVTDDAGAFMPDGMFGMNSWGIGSWQMKPYDPWKYDAVVYEWPTEAQWIEALPRRTAQTFYLSIDTPSGMDGLKQHLANGNLAIAGLQQYKNVMLWGWDTTCQSRPGECPGMSNDVLYSNDGSTLSGGHAITIVGYDDSKEYVDAATGQTKRGALLIANSAGPTWGLPNTAGGASKGFYWMAYEYAQANLYQILYNSDRPHYRPRLYAAARLESVERTSGSLYAGVGFHGWYDYGTFFKFMTANVLPGPWEVGQRPMESTKRLVVDMTDGLSQIDLAGAVPLLFLGFNAYEGGSLGLADFFLDRTGNGSFSRIISPDPVKAIPRYTQDAFVCNNVLQTGDANLDGTVDRNDITLITATTSRPPQCVSDPRDMDRDGRITVLDARKAALRCSRLGCAPR